MQDMTSKPELFFKSGCPFCFKVRLFLLEAGLLDKVDVREACSDDDQDALRRELEPHLEKVGFPAVRLAKDDYLTESDNIIARLVEIFDIRPDKLPTFRAYVDGPFLHLLKLHRENIELKKQAG